MVLRVHKGGNGWGCYEHCSSSDRVTVTGVWVGIVNVERCNNDLCLYVCSFGRDEPFYAISKGHLDQD